MDCIKILSDEKVPLIGCSQGLLSSVVAVIAVLTAVIAVTAGAGTGRAIIVGVVTAAVAEAAMATTRSY